MDNIDINNIRYLQLLIPKLDDSSIANQRQDYANINDQLLDNMMSGLLEDDSSMELPPSMTGRRNTFSRITDKKENNKKKTVKKYFCSFCKKAFKDEDSLENHCNLSGHNKPSNKTSVKKNNKCLSCGRRFKDEATLSFHCAARGHDNPNENGYMSSKSTVKKAVRKKSSVKRVKVTLRCSECNRRFKDNEALQFHYVMSGHANDEEDSDEEHKIDKEVEDTEDEEEEEKEKKTNSVTKLPCGSCNKKFKDVKSLDLHLALSGHSDDREKRITREPESEKRQLTKSKPVEQDKNKRQLQKKESKQKQNNIQSSISNKQQEKKQPGKNQSESSDKQKLSMNERTRRSNYSKTKNEETTRLERTFNCSGCRKKFKTNKELNMHCALSGHNHDESKQTKTNESKRKIEDSESDSPDEEPETKVIQNGKSQNKQNKTNNRYKSNLNCFECGKKFKTLEMLNYHEAFSGHVTQEESDSKEAKTSEEEDDEASDNESDGEQVEIIEQEPDIICSVCSRKFKDKNALYYHMAISGHGASKLGSDRAVKVKPRSRIADLTSSDSSSEESDSDELEESEDSEYARPPRTSRSRNTTSLTKPRCTTCKKQFKDAKTLEYHMALSGHSNNITKRKRGRPAGKNTNGKRKETLVKCATLSVKTKRGRPKKIQEIEDDGSEDETSSSETLKNQKRQCKECGRKCKDQHAYEYHCAMTGHGSTAIVALKKIDLSKCKNSLESDSRDSDSSSDGSSDNRRNFRKRRKIRRNSSDDDSDYEGAGTVRSYQSFMEEVSVWDKWNPKKGLPCRRCGLLFKRTDDLKRHLLTTSHKTSVE